jgi:hypothetical protein
MTVAMAVIASIEKSHRLSLNVLPCKTHVFTGAHTGRDSYSEEPPVQRGLGSQSADFGRGNRRFESASQFSIAESEE